MKKKKIIIISILILILAVILLIIGIHTKQINLINETAKAEYTTKIGELEFDITNQILSANEIKPSLSAGMIPVKKEGDTFVITTTNDNNWYNYSIGKPAYIMLNDGVYQSELVVDMTGKKLASENVGDKVPDDLQIRGTIYMWLPRYAYNTEGETIYIKQESSVAGTYTMPEVFTYQTETRDFSLAGLWIEYEPLSNEKEVTTKETNLNKGETDEIYGFLANVKAKQNNEAIQSTIETYINTVGEDALINITNTNRTILQIIDTNKIEPIMAQAQYNAEIEKIDIEVTYTKNGISKIINKKGEILSENSLTANSADELIGNGTYKYIVIDNKGNLKEIKILVEGLSIYIIPDLETLKEFRDEVNSGNTFEGVKVYQTADISMNEGKYAINEETGEIDFSEDAEQWVPIGKGKQFYGIYDGMGHTISGVYINTTERYQGLFGRVYGSINTQDAEIRNLTVDKSYIKAGDYIGGIVGSTNQSNVQIVNCHNKAQVVGKTGVGGIAGDGVNFINCTNEGKIYGTGYNVGGIVGNCYSSIENCINYGNIEGTNGNIAGIVGSLNSGNNLKQIKNCANFGNIKAEGTNYIAGIVANSDNYFTISECYNTGEITGEGYVAGICAYISGVNNNAIEKCYNTGAIIATSSYAGGIGAYLPLFSGYIKNCYNVGEIRARGDVAGIVGYYNSNGNMENCYNIGNIEATDSWEACGIALTGNVIKCYNIGNITGTDFVYGIGVYTKAQYCFNTGTITSTNYSGGISRDNAIECYNIGEINAKGNDAGGIISNSGNTTAIFNCYNRGNINGNKNSENLGGVAGSARNLSNCYNTGNVIGKKNIGGIVGTQGYYGSKLLNNYFLNTTASCGRGWDSLDNTNAQPLPESSMKGLTSTLNEIREEDGTVVDTQNVWKNDIGINDGYPILSWQTSNDKYNLINGDNAFVEDTEGINNGYPLLAWQVR